MRSMQPELNPNSTLAELVDTLYKQFLEMYGDEELASVAVAAVVSDILISSRYDDDPQ